MDPRDPTIDPTTRDMDIIVRGLAGLAVGVLLLAGSVMFRATEAARLVPLLGLYSLAAVCFGSAGFLVRGFDLLRELVKARVELQPHPHKISVRR